MSRTPRDSTRRRALLTGAVVALLIVAAALMPGWHVGTAAALLGLWVAMQSATRHRDACAPASAAHDQPVRHG